jgi:hypothetical protein
MAGGLINIVSYVSNDLYLTGAPQITFYKMVYRRYTNFAMESIYLDFDDDIKFDTESELVPPRIGDLMHKAYLHLSIPNISITNQDVGIDTSDIQYVYLDQSTISEYEKIRSVYMNILTNIYRIIVKAVNATNVTYVGLVQDVQNYVNTGANLALLDAYDAQLLESRQKLISNSDSREALLDSTRSNLWYILNKININKLIVDADKSIDTDIFEPDSDEYIKELQRIMKNTVKKEIDKGLDFCKDVQNYYFTESQKFIATSTKTQNIKCAWVKNLGHSLIEYIDVFIGGKRIDRHWGIWINIWYQLTYKEAQIQSYNKLIGNVAELTHFDNQEKPSYDMYIPLSFWFNKFNGLAFPMIAMQYNDVRFTLKLRKLEEVFFIERIYKGLLNGSDIVLTAEMIDFIQNKSANKAELNLTNLEMVDDIILSDIWDNKGKRLGGHILMDYVYLESPERKRFAQSGHEYLIERMQYDIFDNVYQTDFDVRLDFTNPSKEIVWVFLKDVYTQNELSWNECRWDDYATTNGKGNPVVSASLNFNNYVRIQKQVGSYFDKMQPYTFHKVSPVDGINMYSFCLDPRQHQPTGSCNFTRLTNVRLFNIINDMFYRYTDSDIYPYDTDIDFKFNIMDPNALLEMIDITYVRKLIKDYKIATTNTGINIGSDTVKTKQMIENYQDAVSSLYIYEQISSGNTVEIMMSDYRKLVFKTTAKCHVFNLTMNILRLIGGYGALAYSGNT